MKLFPLYEIDGEESGHWMRLSLGAGVSVPTEEILGIFDMDTATVSPVTKKFLNTAQKQGRVSVVGDELPKSFVVMAQRSLCRPGRTAADSSETQIRNPNQTEPQVALSQFAPSTLVGRDGHL